jgi:hypothetical protein
MGWKGGFWGRVLGYVWFISFMTWTARVWVDGRVRVGNTIGYRYRLVLSSGCGNELGDD